MTAAPTPCEPTAAGSPPPEGTLERSGGGIPALCALQTQCQVEVRAGVIRASDGHGGSDTQTVAVTINKHEVWDMQRFAEDELGVPFRFDAMMNPRIDCSLSPLAVRLSPEECVEFDVRDRERTTEWHTFADEFHGPVHTPDTEGQLYHCGGGVDTFAINPYGEMTICTLSQQDRYDLRQGTFLDGWNRFLGEIRVNRRATRPSDHGFAARGLAGRCAAA